MKSESELRRLHGGDYADRFEKTQSASRIGNLIGLMKLDGAMDVADFGCGNGMLMPWVCPKVRSYTGVDFSPDFIEKAERRKAGGGFTNAQLVCSSIADFCRAHPDAFDAAFALDFSEHVYDDAWSGILAAIRGSLRPGGAFYLHTPNGRFLLEIMKEHDFLVRQFPEHVAVRTVEENLRLLEGAGFEAAAVRMLPHYNVLKWLHPLSLLPFAGRWFEARIFIEARPRPEAS